MLSTLPWLEESWQSCTRLIAQNRFPQAVLLVGQKGVGKGVLAKALAQLLLCTVPSFQQEGAQACGTCRGCLLYQAQAHPDNYSLGEGKGITIEAVREVIAALSHTIHQGMRRVLMLWNVEQLQTSAANALLKSLEEPPLNTHFILVAVNQNLLPTILGRCITFRIATPSQEQCVHWLQQRHPEATRVVLEGGALIAGNAPFQAERYIDPEMARLLSDMVELLLSDSLHPFYEADFQRSLHAHLQEALYLLYYWLLECVRLKVGTGLASTGLLLVQKQRLLQQVSVKKIVLFLEHVQASIQALPTLGLNKGLLIETLFYRWYDVKYEKHDR